MRRKLIKQGKGALTLSLPKKWIELHSLKPGQEISVREEENSLVVDPAHTARVLETSLVLENDTKEAYRSLLGGLYRGGYDLVKISFSTPRVIPQLQSAVDSLYGYEIFDMKENSCTVKTIYNEETSEIPSHIKRMIHSINTLKNIVYSDLSSRKAHKEIEQFRNNVLKQRDMIIRIIHKKKLLGNDNLPYYTIALSLWGVARNYFNMHLHLAKKPSKEELNILKETGLFFRKSFNKLKMTLEEFTKRNKEYKKVRKKAINLLAKRPSVIASFCLNIIMSVQLADSSLYLMNH